MSWRMFSLSCNRDFHVNCFNYSALKLLPCILYNSFLFLQSHHLKQGSLSLNVPHLLTIE